jgi:aerobic-type carbon monoxide dehydrogenase small subunit (CoxS/CutS family)|tara:strand:- start:1608 stop:2066 length:459 start_codon:yes stop_codon:yes gene_type:complete
MQTLIVNGTRHDVDVEDEMPLLWVLRDELGKTGTKFGCGIGQCGACSVIIDEAVVRSCVYPVISAQGKKITTIEGLGGDHPIQKVWIEEQVPQCGYCQSGQILAASALLSENLNPSDEDIEDKITNLCRCGTYVRVRKAIHKSAELMKHQKN